jgi:hypothetical protein
MTTALNRESEVRILPGALALLGAFQPVSTSACQLSLFAYSLSLMAGCAIRRGTDPLRIAVGLTYGRALSVLRA